jgi:SAM-dependent methyltransferase
MTDTSQKKLPNWYTCYEKSDVKSLPWYFTQLDPDIFDILARLNLVGGTLLDLGTGTGHQAIELARRGFSVVGTDISKQALALAIENSKKEEVPCDFLEDDIINTKLPKNKFDYVFDRGCFHVLNPDLRKTYVNNLANLIRKKGLLFLKCFSSEEPWTEGPYRFTVEEISNIFSSHFELSQSFNTVFHGQRDPLPKAIFCVLKKKLI